jgi:segregation and condensation protein B
VNRRVRAGLRGPVPYMKAKPRAAFTFECAESFSGFATGTDCRMSLKSKLEAVIYAAEEPVTLTQLATLFATEALEWKAAQEAAALQADGAEDPRQSLIAEGLEYLDLRTEDGELQQQPGLSSLSAAEPEQAVEDESGEAGVEGAEAAVVAESATGVPVDAEAEAKREARLRDREVKAALRQLIDEIIASCASDDRGVEIREIAGGYRMATKPECHDAVRMFIKSLKPAMKLSLPALETLAVIAYKQPVTAPEVNEIRGVDSSGVFGSLMARKLITTAGRKQVIGRPILYKTTKEFLLRFGLKDVSELPSMDEFEKMAALELDEGGTETGVESDSSYDAGAAGGGPELDENALEESEAEEVKSAVVENAEGLENAGDAGTAATGSESNIAAERVE